jgi:putative phosphoribosyl transferase
MSRYADRRQAGRVLAQALRHYAGRDDVTVLALPRGGVPVGYEVALVLGATLDIFLVRKIGHPRQPELAIGAVGSGGVQVLNRENLRELGVTADVALGLAERSRWELVESERALRGDRPNADVQGRVVILVDDGLATGATMQAAARGVRQLRPLKVVAAIPVGSRGACAELGAEVDELVCPLRPEPLWAVGRWYEDFAQTSNEEVHALLDAAAAQRASADGARPAEGGL